MECRLAGETEFSEKTCPSATFVHHKIPHDQTRVWTCFLFYCLLGLKWGLQLTPDFSSRSEMERHIIIQVYCSVFRSALFSSFSDSFVRSFVRLSMLSFVRSSRLRTVLCTRRCKFYCGITRLSSVICKYKHLIRQFKFLIFLTFYNDWSTIFNVYVLPSALTLLYGINFIYLPDFV
jgi:hypothetical protein